MSVGAVRREFLLGEVKAELARAEEIELLVRDLIEPVDVASVLLRELIEPDVDGLRDQDDVRHPVQVGAEARHLLVPRPRRLVVPHVLTRGESAGPIQEIANMGQDLQRRAAGLARLEVGEARRQHGGAEGAGRLTTEEAIEHG